MTQSQQQLVIPEPDAFGFRVRGAPLARVIGALRRHNPGASFVQLKSAAEALRSGQDVQGPRPDRFDSGTDSGAKTSEPSRAASAAAGAQAPESAVAAEPDLARLDEIENGKVKRAEAAAWARDNGYDVPAKGFLPAAIITAYRAAMRDKYMASLAPVRNENGTAGEPMPADVPATEVH